MSPFLKCTLGPWAAGAALVAGVWSSAQAQSPGAGAVSTPVLVPAPTAAAAPAAVALTEPASTHVHGAQPAAPASVTSVAPTSAPTVASTSALAPAGSAAPSWPEANQTVARFPRGHADVLRWEQNNLSPPADAVLHPQAGQLTLARATQLALQDQTPWIKPGMSALEMAETRQQAAALRWTVQKLWVDAVAARQSVAHSRDILAVAQAGAELAQRMAQVGNWSRARQIQEELPLWDAQSRLANAELQAERALSALWQRIGAGMTVQAMAQQLPAHLPMDGPTDAWADASVRGASKPATLKLDDVAALQAQALQAHLRWSAEDALAQRLMAGLGLSATDLAQAQKALNDQAGQTGQTGQIEQGRPIGQGAPEWDLRLQRWGHAFENAWQARTQADRLARQVRADVQVAVTAYQMARQSAHIRRAEVLRLHTELSRETLLRYNGMLQSTWDLLASARTRIDSVDAALQAQRQVWLAQADLMAVLAGLPYSASVNVADAPSSSNTSSTAGH